MGCLTINVRKVPATTARVTADCRNHIDVAVACQNGMDVTARCKNGMVVDVQNRNTRISITATLVCEVSIGENGEEMWWCGNWRVIWNNGLPTLWRRN